MVLPELLGVAEDTEGDDCHIDIASCPSLFDDIGGVALGVQGVEVQVLHRFRAGSLELGDRGVPLGCVRQISRMTRALALRR